MFNSANKPQVNQRYKDAHGHRITVASVEHQQVMFYREGYEHLCVQPLERFTNNYQLIAGGDDA
ncbi:hypothetical protein BIY27_23130 [Gibbsiella quercinecans]|nr:DUF4222 domain-containing protein [Gibbsiella quercinecans]RLM03903.1 hypothetical protein BIY27_23130 [Gibbsiella quercinecans]